MLNLAFTNIVTELGNRTISKASIDLIYAVVQAFQLKHSTPIRRVENDQLPSQMDGWVAAISNDLAQHYSEQFLGFLDEYFKIYQYLLPNWKGRTLIYLRPWVALYAKNIEKRPESMKFFFQVFSELPNEKHVFAQNIWCEFAKDESATEAVMRYVLDSENLYYLPVLLGFAVHKSKQVSQIWAEIFFKEKPSSFVCAGCQVLLMAHLFNYEYLPYLIANVTSLRLKNRRANCFSLFISIIHSIVIYTDIQHDLPTKMYGLIAKEVGSNDGIEIFYESPRKWLVNALDTALFLKSILDHPSMQNTKKELYKIYINQFDNSTDIAEKSQSLIYAAAFSEEEGDNFVRRCLKEMKYDIVSVVTTCLALSVAYPSKKLAGSLYLFGATMAYDIAGMAGIDLASSALEICEGVVPDEIPAEAFDYLIAITILLFFWK